MKIRTTEIGRQTVSDRIDVVRIDQVHVRTLFLTACHIIGIFQVYSFANEYLEPPSF